MTQLAKPADQQSVPEVTRAADNLVHPSEQRESHVVIFDGNCRFCQQQVQRLMSWDTEGLLTYVSLHDPYVAEHFPELTYEQLMEQIYVISPDGTAHGGAAAIRHLSRKLSRMWWMMPFLHIPFTLPIWQWGYKQIAKRRYKISQRMENSCDDGSCEVHF